MPIKMGKREANVRRKLKHLEAMDKISRDNAFRQARAHRRFRVAVEAAIARLDADEEETNVLREAAWDQFEANVLGER